jgi:hypothetical protein
MLSRGSRFCKQLYNFVVKATDNSTDKAVEAIKATHINTTQCCHQSHRQRCIEATDKGAIGTIEATHSRSLKVTHTSAIETVKATHSSAIKATHNRTIDATHIKATNNGAIEAIDAICGSASLSYSPSSYHYAFSFPCFG